MLTGLDELGVRDITNWKIGDKLRIGFGKKQGPKWSDF